MNTLNLSEKTQVELQSELKQAIENDTARRIRESIRNFYYVTVDSVVYSVNKRSEKVMILKQIEVDKKYLKVNTGFRRLESVHRLVLEAFDPKFYKGCHTNHINRNVKDNRLVNLEVCTQQENNLHRDVTNKINIDLSIKQIKEIQQEHNVKSTNDIISAINISLDYDYKPQTFSIKFRDQQKQD